MNLTELAPPPAAYQVWLFGGYRLQHDGAAIDVPAGKARSLLAYLLLHPQAPHRRNLLADELWPASPPDRALRRLADTLYRLRLALPADAILANAETVALNRAAAWWVDVWAFGDALTPDAPDDRLAAALALYHADVAPELDDHWLVAHRVRLQELYLAAATRWAGAAEARSDYTTAETRWRLALSVDPLHEGAYRGLMTALARTGRLAAALECYDELVDLLDRELATPPSPATRALAEQLYQELDLARRRDATPLARRLVGRRRERALLLAALDHARAGQAGMVLVLGDAGMGKSLLLDNLTDAAAWRGWQVARGAALPTTAEPYEPLTTALRMLLPGPRAAQVTAELPQLWLELLGGWLPRLRPATRWSAAGDHQAGGDHMAQALAALLDRLQQVAPTLLLLDDVHWADPAMWPLLDALLPRLERQHLLLVLAARPDVLQAQPPVWTRIEAWDRAGQLQVLALAGLADAEIDELAAARGYTLAPDQRRALAAAGAGNPLLSLAILEAGGPRALPNNAPTIAALLEERFRRLSPHARSAVETAAILGPSVDYAIWEQLWQAEQPGDALAPHAVALERAGILVIDQEHYRFAHDAYHAVALATGDADARRHRHAAALRLLAAATPDDHARLLYHAQAAGDGPAIGRHAWETGRRAMQAFAFAVAHERLTLALDYLDDPALQLHARLLRAQANHQRADRAQEAADVAALTAALPQVEQPALAAAIHHQHAAYLWATGRLDEARAAAEDGLATAAGDASVPVVQLAGLHQLAGRIARDHKRRADAAAHIRAAQALYGQAGDAWGVALTEDLLGGLAYDQGDDATAARLHRAAAVAFRELGDPVREAQSLNNLGSAAWALGDYSQAGEVHARSIEVCRSLGNRRGESDNLDNLGGVAWALGDYPLAIRRYNAALALREAMHDQWGVAISLGNLGSAYRMLDDLPQALAYYERSLPLYRAVGRERGEAYILHCRGLTLAHLGRHAEAEADLTAALTLRQGLGDRGRLIETHAALAQAALLRGDLATAQRGCQTALALVEAAARPALRHEAYFTAYRVYHAAGDNEAALDALARSMQAMQEAAAPLTPEDRTSFLTHVPLNRATAEAVAAHATCATVALPAAAGKGMRTVTWRVAMPQDRLLPAGRARRRAVLARLQADAAEQGAAPTHADLAAALGVSRRTVLRDLAQEQSEQER